MDQRTVECYCGFNEKKISENERFYYLDKEFDIEPNPNGYRAIKHLKTFSFDSLPKTTTFVITLEKLSCEAQGVEYEGDEIEIEIGEDSEENHF